MWMVLHNQVTRKTFIPLLAPINAGKIVKNIKNILTLQIRLELVGQSWEKFFYFTNRPDKCWKNRKKY